MLVICLKTKRHISWNVISVLERVLWNGKNRPPMLNSVRSFINLHWINFATKNYCEIVFGNILVKISRLIWNRDFNLYQYCNFWENVELMLNPTINKLKLYYMKHFLTSTLISPQLKPNIMEYKHEGGSTYKKSTQDEYSYVYHWTIILIITPHSSSFHKCDHFPPAIHFLLICHHPRGSWNVNN